MAEYGGEKRVFELSNRDDKSREIARQKQQEMRRRSECSILRGRLGNIHSRELNHPTQHLLRAKKSRGSIGHPRVGFEDGPELKRLL